MEYKLTTVTYTCPHCGKVLRKDSDNLRMFLIILAIGTVLPLFWILARAILKSIFKYDYIEMGSPIKNCTYCENKVNMGGSLEWNQMPKNTQKDWTFRNKMRTAFVLGGFLIITFFLQFLLLSPFSLDRTFGIICVVLTIVFAGIIGFLYYLRKQNLNNDYIIVNNYDYDLILKSQQRYNEINEKEPLEIKVIGTN